jgi:hypothetical protein
VYQPWLGNIAGEIIFHGRGDWVLLSQGTLHLTGFSSAGVAAVLYDVNTRRPNEMITRTKSSIAERFIMAVRAERM